MNNSGLSSQDQRCLCCFSAEVHAFNWVGLPGCHEPGLRGSLRTTRPRASADSGPQMKSRTTHLHRANHSPQPSHCGDSCSQGLLLPNPRPLCSLWREISGVLSWDGLEHPSAYSHTPLFTRDHPAILGAPAAAGGDLGPSGQPGQGRSERDPLLGA